MYRYLLAALAAFVLLPGSTPAPVAAQIRGSEAGVTAQTVDGTTLTIEYSRPTARGRELFGELVPWNVVWTPGANWATTLEVDRRVRLNGTEVPAGRYSVWMIPREHGDWTLSLDPRDELFHFQKPDSTAEQIHVPVTPRAGSHREMLTWSVPSVSGDGALLQLAWGGVEVPVQVVVQPTKPVTLAAEERSRFLGSYDMEFGPIPGWEPKGRLELTEEDGLLRGHLPFSWHPGDELDFDMVPAGRDRFSVGLYHGDELFNVEPAFTLEFDVDEERGRAIAVRVRGIDGGVYAEGVRVEDRGR